MRSPINPVRLNGLIHKTNRKVIILVTDTTRIGIGLNNHVDGLTCGLDVARQAQDRLGPYAVTIALLFVSHPEPELVLRGVNQVLGDVPLIGATSAGEYTHDGYVEDGAGLMLISTTGAQFHPLTYRRRWFGLGKLLGSLTGTSEAGLGSEFNHRALMLFPDDQSMNLDGLVDKAMTETAMLYDILGGPGPTIPAPPRPPAMFINDKVLKSGMVGAEILSQRRFGMALANGWTPLSGPYRVTHVDKRAVTKIDGRPAREVYEDFLAEQDIDFADVIPREVLLRHPIGICNEGACKVSVLMGFDDDGALQMTSPPPENALIHILGTQPQAMSTAAERAIRQALSTIPGTRAAGLLFIDCMSTAMVLDDAYIQQRTAAQASIGDVPFLGFRSHGVLARLHGQTVGHYECSVGACIIPGA